MTFSEVKQLLDAGFTKDEILSLTDPVREPAEDPAETPADPPAETPDIVPADPPAETPADPPYNPQFEELTETMNKLIRTIQASNLQSASMDKPSEDKAVLVDKIMESIIRPDINTKGE